MRAALGGLATLWLLAIAWAAATDVPVLPRALGYAAYLAASAALLAAGGRATTWGAGWRPASGATRIADGEGEGEAPHVAPVANASRAAWRAPLAALATALALWLPFELRLLPTLPLAPRVDGSKLLAVLAGLWLFARVRPVPGMGLALLPRRHDLPLAVGAFAAFAAVALPVGLATGFLTWHPRPGVDTLVVRPLLIYLAIALPEEFLFRGLFQNLLARLLPARAALGAAAVIFGLAHLPDPRYVALATAAGVAYGFVWQRTRSIAASAVTHALVDAIWVLLLRR